MRIILPSNAHMVQVVRAREAENDFVTYDVVGIAGWEPILALLVELNGAGGFAESTLDGVATLDILDKDGNILADYRLTAQGFVHTWQSGTLFLEV